MSALSRSMLARCVVSAVGTAIWAGAVWRLALGEAGPAAAMVAVLGWGLGLIPVHVTLRRPGERPVRRIGHGGRDAARSPTGGWGSEDRASP